MLVCPHFYCGKAHIKFRVWHFQPSLYDLLPYNVLCVLLFLILLSIISVNHHNINIFWQNFFVVAYSRLILRKFGSKFFAVIKSSRKENYFFHLQFQPFLPYNFWILLGMVGSWNLVWCWPYSQIYDYPSTKHPVPNMHSKCQLCSKSWASFWWRWFDDRHTFLKSFIMNDYYCIRN